jgi:hypothetical protein
VTSAKDYFMGGVDDMAVWTRLVWDSSLAMAANGTEDCYVPHNPMEIQCGIKAEGRPQRSVSFGVNG